jgi:hypothetical protein
LKARRLEREKHEAEELLEIEDEESAKEQDESSEYETEYESEEDEGPRLKPVFVRQKGKKYFIKSKNVRILKSFLTYLGCAAVKLQKNCSIVEKNSLSLGGLLTQKKNIFGLLVVRK